MTDALFNELGLSLAQRRAGTLLRPREDSWETRRPASSFSAKEKADRSVVVHPDRASTLTDPHCAAELGQPSNANASSLATQLLDRPMRLSNRYMCKSPRAAVGVRERVPTERL
jgi:hypothetical protein